MGRGSDEVLRDLLGLQEKIYRLFDDQAAHAKGNRDAVSAHWAPPVDIYETREAFVLVAEIPGVDQEEIHLEISDDLLVLSGERPLNTRDPDLSYHRIERPNGIFQRAFRLPVGVDPTKVNATCRDGVLRVNLLKKDETEPRAITIQLQD
jgi:HSP20 family protein